MCSYIEGIPLIHLSSSIHTRKNQKEMDAKHPLHVSQVHQPSATINKIQALVFSISLLLLLYYRFSTLFVNKNGEIPTFSWLLVAVSELANSLYYISSQAYRWKPVSRTVFPERLPSDEKLPSIDVFICTCDPNKEPTLQVMNTVISAMCLDYPTDKLSLYLSDDAGSPITLYGTREAYKFAKKWIPFCKKYGIKTSAPEAYFSKLIDGEEQPQLSTDEFLNNLKEIKSNYELFKKCLEKARESEEMRLSSSRDRLPLIEVMRHNETEEFIENKVNMPRLVYVSREKRSTHHHNFKAGAINVLLRVSGLISNAPYLLVLDCDMNCNDPMSARQAMCFILDPMISKELAFVQFPQYFHNISENDIYNSQMRTLFKIWCCGLNGLMGPFLCGTGFFLNREALYKNSVEEDINLLQAKKWLAKKYFGTSNELIASISGDSRHHNIIENEDASNKLLDVARLVASGGYEQHTQWGQQIGFRYHSLVEDFLTGMLLHAKGWTSVYYDPPQPAFLGTGTTNLNDTLVQNTRWNSGLLQVSMSKFCPLTYQPSKMSILQTLAYSCLAFQPLTSFSVLCLSIVPQLCLLKGITLYPKVSDPWFAIFAIVYMSYTIQYFVEVLSIGGSFKLFWNGRRTSFTVSAIPHLFSCVEFFLKCIGMKDIDYRPTNKSSMEDEIKKYHMGIFDFETDIKFLLIFTTIATLNVASFLVGLLRAITETSYNKLFGQISLSFAIVAVYYPVLEAMALRKDKGSISTHVTVLTMGFLMVIYYMFNLLL